MALNIIERLSLIAEKLGVIAEKIEGGGGGSLEPRVENLEHNVSSLSTNLYNVANSAAYISSLAKRWEGSGEVGSYYYKDGSKGIYKCLVQTMSEPSYDSSDWELVIVGDELAALENKIGYFDFNMAGTVISHGGSGAYYSDPTFFYSALPSGATPIAATIYGSFDEGVTCILQSYGIVFQAPNPRTITANRLVRVVYIR